MLIFFIVFRCKSFQSPQLCSYGYYAMYHGVGLTQNAFTHRWSCWSNWPLPKWQEKDLEVKCFLTSLGNLKIQQFLQSWDSKSIKITLISGQGKLIHFTGWFVFNQFHFLVENSCWHSSDTSNLLNTHWHLTLDFLLTEGSESMGSKSCTKWTLWWLRIPIWRKLLLTMKGYLLINGLCHRSLRFVFIVLVKGRKS